MITETIAVVSRENNYSILTQTSIFQGLNNFANGDINMLTIAVVRARNNFALFSSMPPGCFARVYAPCVPKYHRGWQRNALDDLPDYVD